MRCNHPIVVRGVIFPCGHCMPCRINRREEWTTRIVHECEYASSSCFVTLTYSPLHAPIYEDPDGNLSYVPSKSDVQEFIHKLRKKAGNGVRYYIGSERGPTTNRPHYHGIIWNLPQECMAKDFLESVWSKGFVTVSEVTRQRAAYVAKYHVEREDFRGKPFPDFSLMSRRPGIGNRFIMDNIESIGGNELSYTYRQGKKVPLPRYYRNKAYSEETRERKFSEYLAKQDFSEFERRHRIGGELDSLMERDYKSKHKKEI